MAELDPKPVEQAATVPRAKALMGSFDRSLDGKKRLVIPSTWRAALGPDTVYVMPDATTHSLQLIPKDMMDARLEEFYKAPISDSELNALLTAIGESSEQLEFDTMGRIRICDRLLAFAGITGPVVMKGSVRMVNIWPAKAKSSTAPIDTDKLAAAMAKLKF